MNIRYKLLNNDTAVLLTRKSLLVYDTFSVFFDGAPENSIAIFTFPGGSCYRSIQNNKCVMPAKKLSKEVQVTLAIPDSDSLKKIACETLKAEPQINGGILLSPADMNFAEEIPKLKLDFHKISEEIKKIRDDIALLTNRLEEITEGYNIT